MNTSFPSLRIEGGLLSGEMIDKIAEASPDIPGQKPVDFGLEPNRPLIDEIASAWNDARSYWALFQKSLERLKPDDPGTTLTRDRWMVPFFSLLGYNLQPQRKAAGIEGASYFISHRAGVHEQAPPIHITGFRQSLERRPESGVPRLAPHSLVQEYLNRSEELWGIVTNGFTLRLLRDSHLIRRQAYIEFDLKEIIEGERFADFALLYRLIHATRLPKGVEDADKCLLEQYYRNTVEQGGRVRDHLRDGVERAIIRFGNGFLQHPKNAAFRANIGQKTVEPFDYYQQLLRLIYRFLFLMVSEERGLISDNNLYRQHYSITRVRNLAGIAAAYNDFEDLWASLRAMFSLFTDESAGTLLQVPPLNGDLFDPARTATLNPLSVSNRDLLHAMWDLSMYREKEKAPWRRINYAALDVEELGSVYESLLEFQPVFSESDGKPTFDLLTGTERKSTGSYYTPPELVNELIQSALVPVIQDRLKEARTPAEKEQQLLALTVCDPACGSGHFLLAAARRIGRELAIARTGDEEPSPEQMRLAIRDIITHCIYGVDKNPLAVDLCKVALWLEGHTALKPLTFLDHRIRCGDSLVGVSDLSVLKDGIPDEAFTAVVGDDKTVARELKKQNKIEREHRRLADFDIEMTTLTASRLQVNAIADDKPEDIRKKRELLSSIQQEGTPWCKDKTACDLWTAAFFVGLTKERVQSRNVPTTDTLREYVARSTVADIPQVKIARQLANKYKFFHWALEFTEVFSKGGFDCVIGNPPWERIKLQQQEFFATRDLDIAKAPNKAVRGQLIKRLKETNPILLNEYERALYETDAISRFLRLSKRFPLTGTGDINTYAVFAEHSANILCGNGHTGIILPTGIATDSITAPFFKSLIISKRIVSITSFENEEHVFPAVDHRYKFCIVHYGGENLKHDYPDFIFFCRNFNDVKNIKRHFTLTTEDFQLINPNTFNCPIFRTQRDSEIIKAIYRRVPILINDNYKNGNPWEISLQEMFHMAMDSHIFKTSSYFGESIDRVQNNILIFENEKWMPLYEAKMFYLYDHRYGSYEGKSERGFSSLPVVSDQMHKNPNYLIYPWYWIPEKELATRVKWDNKWFLALRKITNATNERCGVFSLIPYCGISNSAEVCYSKKSILYVILLFANFNSIIFDYILRMKMGGTNFSFFILKQIAVIPQKQYSDAISELIIVRVIQLTFTAWDLEPFAQDVLKEIGADTWNRWFPNNPLKEGRAQPFIWNDERRAILRAELDACYAKLYGLNREELEYILGTFPVLQKNEEGKFGEYRTEKLVMNAWNTIGIDEKFSK